MIPLIHALPLLLLGALLVPGILGILTGGGVEALVWLLRRWS